MRPAGRINCHCKILVPGKSLILTQQTHFPDDNDYDANKVIVIVVVGVLNLTIIIS
jgi:hypothetical protein